MQERVLMPVARNRAGECCGGCLNQAWLGADGVHGGMCGLPRTAGPIRQPGDFNSLTGLPGRALFFSAVEQALARWRAQEVGAAVAFIDLDLFMRINNSFGYAAGDEIIRHAGERLCNAVVPEGGVAAHFGRDEFALCFPYEGGADAADFAARVMAAFRRPFTSDGMEFNLSLSMGVCLDPGAEADLATLLINAENAMFRAKDLGRNNCQFFSQEMRPAGGDRLLLETCLRRAVEKDQLFLQFQPVVDANTGRISGAEALVRWRHPEYGVVPPDRFIPLADETGLITEIGSWVLLQACTQAKAWHDLGFKDLGISVNVSAVQFRQTGLIERVSGILQKTGIRPGSLELEITESVLMHDAESTIVILRALKAMGVRVSIDDFGTGYSSLNYLKRFPIDTLKIDRSFVREVNVDPDDAAIVRAIITLAKSLNLSLVAEGVENREQQDFLRHERCDTMQGYLFSRPLGPDDLLCFVKANQAMQMN